MTPMRRNRSLIALLIACTLLFAACDAGTTETFPPATLSGFTDIAPFTPLPPTSTPLNELGTQIAAIRTATAGAQPPTNTPSRTPRTTATPIPPTATLTLPPASTSASGVVTAQIPGGYIAQKGFWQVYFTNPSGSRDERTYTGGIDELFAASIAAARTSIDIAAYEFNLPTVTRAVLDAHRRGVTVRVVTDLQDGLQDEDTTLNQLIDAGIPVVPDTRTALMHNKFAIIDRTLVWTGSWNYTINDTYRNNNNAIVLRSRSAVANYQAEFDEMFVNGQFGPRSPENTPNVTFNQDGTPIEVYFAPETNVLPVLTREINAARRSIQFMAFSFTLDEMGDALIARDSADVDVRGIFETVGSETQYSELTRLFCAGVQARQDGSAFILHHKVFIIDGRTVITGSFNFSSSAIESNDENLLIIRDADLAAQYLAEFERRWAQARTPDGLRCS
jgi:phosphatidylserine/phosphatidylglycerophosphate/cardiolipin synthase-like enzyme